MHSQVCRVVIVVENVGKRVSVDDVESPTRFQELRYDLGPTLQVREPDQDPVRREYDVVLRLQDVR